MDILGRWKHKCEILAKDLGAIELADDRNIANGFWC